MCGSPIKILGVSNENMGVSNENLGVSNETSKGDSNDRKESTSTPMLMTFYRTRTYSNWVKALQLIFILDAALKCEVTLTNIYRW